MKLKMRNLLAITVTLCAAIFILTGCGARDTDSIGAGEKAAPEVEHASEPDPTKVSDISEKDSKTVATEYVLKLAEYTKANGRDLQFVSGDRTFCDSCYKFTFSYIADSDKPDFKTDKITVDVNVQGGQVVNYGTASTGVEARPASELCQRVLTCENGDAFPVERYDESSKECLRVVYLANPCLVNNARSIVADTPELKKCVGEADNRLDITAAGEYICVFPDESFCSVDTYYSGACSTGKCKRECKRGVKGEGLYSTCTGNLLKLMECER